MILIISFNYNVSKEIIITIQVLSSMIPCPLNILFFTSKIIPVINQAENQVNPILFRF